MASRQQRTVALSTAEAETSALLDLGRDIIWLRRLMHDIGTPVTDPTPALEDNRSAIKWSTNAASWSRTRHMDVYFHKIREWQRDKILKIEHCPTTEQVADICTKSLPQATHSTLKVMLLGEHEAPNHRHNDL